MGKKTKTVAPDILYRVDINLSYLFLTKNKEYGSKEDVVEWLNDSAHTGELDSENDKEKFSVKEVKSLEDVEDYDLGYFPYSDEIRQDEPTLEDIKDELGLDTQIMIKKLKALGYSVTKK